MWEENNDIKDRKVLEFHCKPPVIHFVREGNVNFVS